MADTFAFGSVSPGTDRDGSFVISNQGDDDLTLSNFSFSNPAFTLHGAPLLTIPADSERVLTIRFSPTNANTDYASTLTFSTNDAGNSSVTVDLLGDSYPVGLVKDELADQIQVFPVSCANWLFIQTPAGLQDNMQAQLSTLDGRIIRRMPVDVQASKNGMDIANINPGFYLLQVAGPQGKVVKKVLIK